MLTTSPAPQPQCPDAVRTLGSWVFWGCSAVSAGQVPSQCTAHVGNAGCSLSLAISPGDGEGMFNSLAQLLLCSSATGGCQTWGALSGAGET